MRDRLPQRNFQYIGLSRGRDGLHPRLDGQLNNMHVPLCAEYNVAARSSTQKPSYPLHSFLGHVSECLGNLYLSGGELHFHG